MAAEAYSNEYKRYASFCPDYPGTELKKIASGSYNDDYHWIETIMKKVPIFIPWGVSLHYYIFPGGNFNKKGLLLLLMNSNILML